MLFIFTCYLHDLCVGGKTRKWLLHKKQGVRCSFLGSWCSVAPGLSPHEGAAWPHRAGAVWRVCVCLTACVWCVSGADVWECLVNLFYLLITWCAAVTGYRCVLLTHLHLNYNYRYTQKGNSVCGLQVSETHTHTHQNICTASVSRYLAGDGMSVLLLLSLVCVFCVQCE